MNVATASRPGPASRRRVEGLAALALILTVGFVVRALALRDWSRSALFLGLTGDELLFHRTALQIVAGGAGDGAHFYQPLYGWFLALVYWLCGPQPALVRVVQLGLGLVTVALFYGVGREMRGNTTGLLAAAIAALYGPAVFFELQLLSPALTLPLTVLGLWLLLRAMRRGDAWLLAPSGLAFGLALLARPNLATTLPVALGAWWLAAGERRRRVTGAALAVAGLGVALLPSWVHNARAGAAAAAVSTSAGANFYIGNNPTANGTFHVPRGVGIDPENHEVFAASLARVAERAEGRQLSAAQVSRYWLDRGLEFWRRQPWAALRLYLVKLRLGLGREELANHFSYRAVSEWVAALRWLVGFGLIVPLAAAGLALGWRDPAVRWLGLWAAAYLGGVALFFVADGYRLLLLGPLLPLAALGVEEGVTAIRARQRWRTALALIACAVGAALSWPVSTGEERQRADRADFWNMAGMAEARRGRADRAESAFRHSIEIAGSGGAGPARANLGQLLERRGELDEARRLYREAIAAWPELRPAYESLARLEERTGHRDEALRLWRALAAISADATAVLPEIDRLERAASGTEAR